VQILHSTFSKQEVANVAHYVETNFGTFLPTFYVQMYSFGEVLLIGKKGSSLGLLEKACRTQQIVGGRGLEVSDEMPERACLQ
jgi:hypothetical protein